MTYEFGQYHLLRYDRYEEHLYFELWGLDGQSAEFFYLVGDDHDYLKSEVRHYQLPISDVHGSVELHTDGVLKHMNLNGSFTFINKGCFDRSVEVLERIWELAGE
jgi:hypothetical protein